MDGYDIPQIIVVGEESSGKSSLLENIIKCPIFPRDTKYCTKVPIHLTLKYNINCHNEISYCGKTQYVEKEKIVDEISKIFNTIGNNVNYDPIEVLITAPYLQDFEFYDLPGIRAYPKELSDKTKDICESFLKRDNVLVICVVPATNTLLTSSDAFALIQKYNKANQTILALTMVDRLQPANIKDLLIDRLLGYSDELENIGLAGCVGIFNRSHLDTENLKMHHIAEQLWFKENILDPMPNAFKSVRTKIEDNITSQKLIDQLNGLFKKYIRNHWIPKAVLNAKRELSATKREIHKLGRDPSNLILSEIVNILLKKIDDLWINDIDLKSVIIENNEPDKTINNVKNVNKSLSANKNKIVKSENKLLSIVNNRIKQYISAIQQAYLNKINDCFDDKCSLKLIRFTQIKNYICNAFNEFYIRNETKFNQDLSAHLINLVYENKCQNHSIIAINKILMFILCPSIVDLIEYIYDYEKIKDLFIENDDYSNKRKLLMEQKNKIIHGIVELNDLKRENI